MSKGLLIGLFSVLFFAVFALFQFEADSRRKNKDVNARLKQLNIKMSTYIRGKEANDPERKISQVNDQQQNLLEDFRLNKKTISELLELVVEKNEEQEKELTKIKEELEDLKKRINDNKGLS